MLAAVSNPRNLTDCEKREGLPASFRLSSPNPALNILRPAIIPSSARLYDSVNFDMSIIPSPSRSDLLVGLLTLNSLGVVSDDDLRLVADASWSDMTMWNLVEGGFGSFSAQCEMPDGSCVSQLVATAFPLKAIGRSLLQWHEARPALVSNSTIEDLCLLPTLSNGNQASEALAQRLPSLICEHEARIAEHLNALMESPGNSAANELPLYFQPNSLNGATAPLTIGGFDMLALNFTLKTSDFEPAYWAAMVSALRLIGAFLRPMMTPEDTAELCPIQMDQDEDELLSVLAELQVRGQKTDDKEAVEAILSHTDCEFAQCFYGFHRALSGYELNREAKNRWLADKAWVSLADFPSQVANLPLPVDDLGRTTLEWLRSVVQALPLRDEESALVRVRDLAVCEGSIDMMLPVFFDDDREFADAAIQPVYEVLMSDAEESVWYLGWNIPAELLERFSEGIRVGNELLIDLDHRISC